MECGRGIEAEKDGKVSSIVGLTWILLGCRLLEMVVLRTSGEEGLGPKIWFTEQRVLGSGLRVLHLGTWHLPCTGQKEILWKQVHVVSCSVEI